MWRLYELARRDLQEIATEYALSYRREMGGGWASAVDSVRAIHLVRLSCPTALLAIEGVGRFELDLGSDQWVLALRQYLDGSARVVADDNCTRILAQAGGEDFSIEGAHATAHIGGEASSIILDELRERVCRYQSLVLHHIPPADRVVIAHPSGAAMALDFFGPRLARWSIDPISSPDFEVDLGDGGAGWSDLIDPFCSGEWAIREVVSWLGRRRLLLQWRSRHGWVSRVTNRVVEPPACAPREDFPWVQWIGR